MRENDKMSHFMERRLRKTLWWGDIQAEKDGVETVIGKVSQKEVQMKEMKNLAWEIGGKGGGGV